MEAEAAAACYDAALSDKLLNCQTDSLSTELYFPFNSCYYTIAAKYGRKGQKYCPLVHGSLFHIVGVQCAQ